MPQKLFLTSTAVLTLLSILQTTDSSWAAKADKPTSQAEKNQASQPKKEHANNLSVYMHGAYVVGIHYIDCEGKSQYETLSALKSINRCAKVGSEVFVERSDGGNKRVHKIDLHFNNQDASTKSITVPAKGIKMNCGKTIYNTRCDWSTPYEMQ